MPGKTIRRHRVQLRNLHPQPASSHTLLHPEAWVVPVRLQVHNVPMHVQDARCKLQDTEQTSRGVNTTHIEEAPAGAGAGAAAVAAAGPLTTAAGAAVAAGAACRQHQVFRHAYNRVHHAYSRVHMSLACSAEEEVPLHAFRTHSMDGQSTSVILLGSTCLLPAEQSATEGIFIMRSLNKGQAFVSCSTHRCSCWLRRNHACCKDAVARCNAGSCARCCARCCRCRQPHAGRCSRRRAR